MDQGLDLTPPIQYCLLYSSGKSPIASVGATYSRAANTAYAPTSAPTTAYIVCERTVSWILLVRVHTAFAPACPSSSTAFPPSSSSLCSSSPVEALPCASEGAPSAYSRRQVAGAVSELMASCAFSMLRLLAAPVYHTRARQTLIRISAGDTNKEQPMPSGSTR